MAVGGDHPLEDAPGGFDLDVLGIGEQDHESFALPVSEQVLSGVQGPPGPVQRVVAAASVAVQVLLDPAPALVQGIPGEPDDVEGVHDRHRAREFLSGGGLEPGEPVHRDHLHRVTPRLGPVGEPGLERGLGAALEHIQQPCRAGPVADRGEINDDGDVLVALPRVPPDVLVDPDDRDPVEPCRVADQDPRALGQNGLIRGIPRDREPFGDPGHAQMLHDQCEQGPPQSSPGDLRARLGRGCGVLPPHPPAAGAPVAAHGDQQRRGSPPERLVRQPARDHVVHAALTAAPPAPPVIIDNPASQHCTIRLEALPGHLQPETVQAAERRQIGRGEGTVGHVVVFLMGSVRTPIM